jgi:hypothetical protein
LPEEWKELVIVPIHKMGDKEVVINTAAYLFAKYVKIF